MRFANMTDVGRQREHNEDNLLSSQFAFGEGRRRMDYVLHVVADGMGGAAAGEVASSLTVETISLGVYHALLHSHIDQDQKYLNPAKVLQIAVEQANHKVYSTAREIPKFLGMGATVTSILVCQGKAFIAQVGDSRAYLLRDGKLRQITRDHSRVKIQVDLFREELRAGDVLLACSDGLSGMVTDDEIRAMVSEALMKKVDQLIVCEQLIQKANEAGGSDNITVSLALIEPSDIPARRVDHIALAPDDTLTWDEAARLELEDESFVRVDV
jgi:serine/threonine protein phosphatase PrpC